MKKPVLPYRIVAFPADGRVRIFRFDDVALRDQALARLEATGTSAFSCTVDWIAKGADEVGYHRER